MESGMTNESKQIPVGIDIGFRSWLSLQYPHQHNTVTDRDSRHADSRAHLGRKDVTMKTLSNLVLLSVLLVVTACGGHISPEATPTDSIKTIITHGTVVDGRGSEPIRDGIVVIVKDRITFVGRAVDYPDRAQAQVIDAHGGTILPGIIDAHVHGASDPAIRRKFLISGVTAVCDLGFPLDNMHQFNVDYLGQDPVARGFRAGPIITAPGGLPDAVLHEGINYEVATPDEARKAVVDLYNRGSDVIKVYLQQENNGVIFPMLSDEELDAIVEEAHAHGLLVHAHVTHASLLGMAVRAGVDVIEHVPMNITESEYKNISESQWQGFLESHDPLQVFFSELYPQYETQLEVMVKAGIVMVPTLDSYWDLYRASNPTRQEDVAMVILMGIVRRFHELGGDVGLGSDWIINTGAEAGMPAEEMEMLQAAGLTPMEVLEAGTRQSAYICGHGDELGILQSGRLADVIVVDGDPLEDLKAMSQVVLVIKDGEIAVNSEWKLPADE
jgi:imidazolonepropionase-like amidohydrolase